LPVVPLVGDPVAEVDRLGTGDHVVPVHDARVVRDLGIRAVVHDDDVLDRLELGQVLAEQREQ
jgi:hypothetical protein